MEENLTRSIEDYLEAIYVFELEGENNIPSLKVAKTLNVSKAAVAKAMNRLHDEGYILKLEWAKKTQKLIAVRLNILYVLKP